MMLVVAMNGLSHLQWHLSTKDFTQLPFTLSDTSSPADWKKTTNLPPKTGKLSAASYYRWLLRNDSRTFSNTSFSIQQNLYCVYCVQDLFTSVFPVKKTQHNSVVHNIFLCIAAAGLVSGSALVIFFPAVSAFKNPLGSIDKEPTGGYRGGGEFVKPIDCMVKPHRKESQ